MRQPWGRDQQTSGAERAAERAAELCKGNKKGAMALSPQRLDYLFTCQQMALSRAFPSLKLKRFLMQTAIRHLMSLLLYWF